MYTVARHEMGHKPILIPDRLVDEPFSTQELSLAICNQEPLATAHEGRTRTVVPVCDGDAIHPHLACSENASRQSAPATVSVVGGGRLHRSHARHDALRIRDLITFFATETPSNKSLNGQSAIAVRVPPITKTSRSKTGLNASSI
jgi:hypothetical protein